MERCRQEEKEEGDNETGKEKKVMKEMREGKGDGKETREGERI